MEIRHIIILADLFHELISMCCLEMAGLSVMCV